LFTVVRTGAQGSGGHFFRVQIDFFHDWPTEVDYQPVQTDERNSRILDGDEKCNSLLHRKRGDQQVRDGMDAGVWTTAD
jgi:hypothetical protein